MINIGIVGFGNLGKALLRLAKDNDNFNIVAVFSRRKIECDIPTYPLSDAKKFIDQIDIIFMCGGSENDLLTQTPTFAKNFSVIDTFDTHAKINEHYKRVDKICRTNSTSAIISCGWDPGLFSIFRAVLESIFQETQCFYGKGISMGHTNAIKRVSGVIDAKQYTIANKKAVNLAKKGKKINTYKHLRKCYVVTNKNHKKIAKLIKNIPNYFKNEHTKIKFITQKTLNKKHNNFKHKGQIYSFSKIDGYVFKSLYKISMDSNPLLTASILLAYSKALYFMKKQGVYRALTPLEIPVSWLYKESIEDIIKKLC